MPQASPAWLCYGDYVCLSSRASGDRKQKKYILGHSSPLVKLGRDDESSLNFASLVFCENPATVPFTHASVSSGPLTFDVTTNVRDYWFEILPRTDYDMNVQLNMRNKQLSQANVRLKTLIERKASFLKAATERLSQPSIHHSASDSTAHEETLTADLHISRSPPDAEFDEQNGTEMLPMMSPSPGILSRRSSIQDPDFLMNLQNEIDRQKEFIRTVEEHVSDYQMKAKHEEQGNEETILRASGDALIFGSVIQLRHVNSRRFLSTTKQADRVVELSPHGRPGSLFIIERASGGVAAGAIKVPADEDVRIFLRSVGSNALYVCMESNTGISDSKFPLNLDIELDGIYSAEACVQLGLGALVSGDDRLEWTIERAKCVTNDDAQSELDTDDGEDSDVNASEVLSGCQIIRLFHRHSESFLCAAARKIDRGKVFFCHRTECDASKGPGLSANSYWMVIDGDNNVSNSGEDLELDTPVILQHVVSGMVLVAVRHLPATSDTGSKATNHEDFLSDDDETVDALDGEETKLENSCNALRFFISSFLKAISDVVSFCECNIGSSVYSLADFELSCTPHESPQISVCNSGNEGDNRVKQWIGAEKSEVVSILQEALSSFFKRDDLTLLSIAAKSQEIEYEVSRWFNMPVFERHGVTLTAQQAIEQIMEKMAIDENERAFAFAADGGSQSGLSQSRVSESLTQENRSHDVARRRTEFSDTRSRRGNEDNITILSDATSQRVFSGRVRHFSNPLRDFARLIIKFGDDIHKKNNQSVDDYLWTFHVMSPKRILKYRRTLDGDPCVRLSAPFMMACRWNFCTKHEKVKSKQESRVITANSLFGIEVKDSEGVFLLGHHRETFQQASSSETIDLLPSGFILQNSRGNRQQLGKQGVSMSGYSTSTKDLDSELQSKMLTQLFNIEFVSSKASDGIKKGAQVASIIRNFCLQLDDMLETKNINRYLAFLRRYGSRLIEALKYVACSCMMGGFDSGGNNLLTLETNPHGQSFFGSLGIINMIFSVVQVIFVACRAFSNQPVCAYNDIFH
jgi:hypothetical protein